MLSLQTLTDRIATSHLTLRAEKVRNDVGLICNTKFIIKCETLCVSTLSYELFIHPMMESIFTYSPNLYFEF